MKRFLIIICAAVLLQQKAFFFEAANLVKKVNQKAEPSSFATQKEEPKEIASLSWQAFLRSSVQALNESVAWPKFKDLLNQSTSTEDLKLCLKMLQYITLEQNSFKAYLHDLELLKKENFLSLESLVYLNLIYLPPNQLEDLEKVLDDFISFEETIDDVKDNCDLFLAIVAASPKVSDFSSQINRTFETAKILKQRISKIKQFSDLETSNDLELSVDAVDHFKKVSVMIVLERFFMHAFLYQQEIVSLSDQSFCYFLNGINSLIQQATSEAERLNFFEFKISVLQKELECWGFLTSAYWSGTVAEKKVDDPNLICAKNFLQSLIAKANQVLSQKIKPAQQTVINTFLQDNAQKMLSFLQKNQIAKQEDLDFSAIVAKKAPAVNSKKSVQEQQQEGSALTESFWLEDLNKQFIQAFVSSENYLASVQNLLSQRNNMDTSLKFMELFDQKSYELIEKNSEQTVASISYFDTQNLNKFGFLSLLNKFTKNLFYAEPKELKLLKNGLQKWKASKKDKKKILDQYCDSGDLLLATTFINPAPINFSTFVAKSFEMTDILLNRLNIIELFSQEHFSAKSKKIEADKNLLQKCSWIFVLERMIMLMQVYKDQIKSLDSAEFLSFFSSLESLIFMTNLETSDLTSVTGLKISEKSLACMDFMFQYLWTGSLQDSSSLKQVQAELVSAKNFVNLICNQASLLSEKTKNEPEKQVLQKIASSDPGSLKFVIEQALSVTQN